MAYVGSSYRKYEEVIRYLIVGALTTFVSLISYYLSVITVLNPNNPLELQIANIFSWVCAVTFAYVTNRKYVFQSKAKKKSKEVISFISSRILTLILDMLIMFIAVTVFHMNDKIVKLMVQIIVIITNYILSKYLVFRS